MLVPYNEVHNKNDSKAANLVKMIAFALSVLYNEVQNKNGRIKVSSYSEVCSEVERTMINNEAVLGHKGYRQRIIKREHLVVTDLTTI